MMNGYNGFDGYGYGWDGGMPYGHPYISGDVAAWLAPMLFFMLAIAFALVAFQIWLYYRIFAKAGYNGWWALLSLIPGVGTLVVLLVLAFDNWPIYRPEGSPATPGVSAVPPYSPTGYAPAAPVSPAVVATAAPSATPAPVATAPAEPPVPPVPVVAPHAAPNADVTVDPSADDNA